MQLNSGEKKALTIFAVVAVVFVIVVGISVYFLTSDARSDDGRPDIELSVGDQTIEMAPSRWCDVEVTECDPAALTDMTITELPVPIGETITMTVPEEIYDIPWRTILQFSANGEDVQEAAQYTPGETRELEIFSSPDKVLVNIEVQLPSAVADADGSNNVARALYAINTIPEGFDPAG